MSNRFVRQYQEFLASHGFPLTVDGIRGRETIGQVKAFQRQYDLTVDGLVGPETWGKMQDLKAKAENRVRGLLPAGRNGDGPYDLAPWMDFAKSMDGWHERRNYGKVKRFLSTVASWFDPIKHAWCGMWMAAVIAHCLPDEKLPNNPAGSINWRDWSDECKPQYGAILVFWRGKPTGWKGHIGFYVGEDATCYHVLGANQRNAVNVTRIKKTRLRKGGCRWPSTAMEGDGRAIHRMGQGAISTNEA
ncbi:MAG: peptidoglycan-binding protein [Pseudomonadota bacterium]